jgi:protoheme IX farnesyltransferase
VSLAIERPAVRRLALGYLELTKPRIVTLVVLTGVPAALDAGRDPHAPARFWAALLGTALAAAAAACFNMYLDRDIDGRMRRTRRRPLPAGLLPPSHALALGAALAALSWIVLVSFTSILAAILAQLSIAYYALVYTAWLKRRTPQNIVIGGGAGASAPLIAWAAMTGHLSIAALLMAGMVFLWTPPHFWSLALVRRDDYVAAGIPMLPVTHGERETRRRILLYVLALVPVTLALGPLGVAGPIYWVPAALLGALFIARAARLWRGARPELALGLFHYSIAYLFALFVLLTVDALVRAPWHTAVAMR